MNMYRDRCGMVRNIKRYEDKYSTVNCNTAVGNCNIVNTEWKQWNVNIKKRKWIKENDIENIHVYVYMSYT